MSSVRFTSFPRTEPPPAFESDVIEVFRKCENRTCTRTLSKGLTSDRVLEILRPGLTRLGFEVEGGKQRVQRIERPVFFGESGAPTVQYQIDAYHSTWRSGLEVEAGRAWMGNAFYRDLVLALVMVNVDHLFLAVSNSYKFNSGGRQKASPDYNNAIDVAEALYGHTRIRMPYRLTVIGY